MTTTTTKVDDIYAQITPLTRDEQLLLLKRIADGLVADAAPAAQPEKTRSLLEFEGVGARNPIGMDAQEYVNQMRDEWDDDSLREGWSVSAASPDQSPAEQAPPDTTTPREVAMTIEELYAQEIRSRTTQERLRLLELVTRDLAEQNPVPQERRYSLLELDGAGVHNPVGMDPQEYINQMRDEWDDPQCPR